MNMVAGGCVAFIALLSGTGAISQNPPMAVTRGEMLLRAQELAQFRWSPTGQSQIASCLTGPKYRGPKYVSDFKVGDTVVGLPYDWGGDDNSSTFKTKLSSGNYGAGSHQMHECESCGHCTAGTDCSGFVSYCWHLSRHYGTQELSQFTLVPSGSKFNVFKDLKSGDALLSPGHHVVLFDSYDQDGDPVVYEASGSAKKVLRQKHPWSYFTKKTEYFSAVRYIAVKD